MGKKTYRFCNLRKQKDFTKKQLTLLICVTSLLCSPRADLWPFYEFLCKYELADPHMTYYDKFCLLYLNMDKALKNSTPYCSF